MGDSLPAGDFQKIRLAVCGQGRACRKTLGVWVVKPRFEA
jgi:hypothetical protein